MENNEKKDGYSEFKKDMDKCRKGMKFNDSQHKKISKSINESIEKCEIFDKFNEIEHHIETFFSGIEYDIVIEGNEIIIKTTGNVEAVEEAYSKIYSYLGTEYFSKGIPASEVPSINVRYVKNIKPTIEMGRVLTEDGRIVKISKLKKIDLGIITALKVLSKRATTIKQCSQCSIKKECFACEDSDYVCIFKYAKEILKNITEFYKGTRQL